MRGRTHVVAGVASLCLLTIVPGALTSANLLPVVVSAVLGAMFPDLDAAQSKLRSLEVGGIRSFVPASLLAHRWLGHRGFLHSVGCLAGVAVAATASSLWVPGPTGAAFALGYANHLLLDAATVSGVPLLGRYSRRMHVLPPSARIRTGSETEEGVFAFVAVAAFGVVIRQLFG